MGNMRLGVGGRGGRLKHKTRKLVIGHSSTHTYMRGNHMHMMTHPKGEEGGQERKMNSGIERRMTVSFVWPKF
jgi:hypothetical protein